MRSRSSFVTLGLLAEKKPKKKTRTVTVWPKMELMESLVKTSVRPFDSSTCTLQTENTGKKREGNGSEVVITKNMSKVERFFFLFFMECSARAFPDILLPFLCGRRSKYLRLVMQHCVAVTQSFLWMTVCGYGTDAVWHEHGVCKVFKTKQILHVYLVFPITTG